MAVRELHSSPSMAALFARAGAGAIPGAAALPFVGGRGRDIPDLVLVLRDVGVDRERLAAYDRVCGFALGDTLPATYPHMLAFPLQLALMTDASFPFAAIGLVHIANTIIQHRAIRAGERLDLKVWATPLSPHPRGRQFSLRTEVNSAGELVWEEVSTNLRRGRAAAPEPTEQGAAPGPADQRAAPGPPDGAPVDGVTSPADAPDTAPPPPSELPDTATWKLRGDLGRRYAAVSGDLNPIHLHPLSARLFGFRSAIAHGMWTKARCLAALQPQLPHAFTAEVQFRKPIVLPATVTFGERAGAGGIEFGVRDARRGSSHLHGEVSFAD
jgi:acyl dehydratase